MYSTITTDSFDSTFANIVIILVDHDALELKPAEAYLDDHIAQYVANAYGDDDPATRHAVDASMKRTYSRLVAALPADQHWFALGATVDYTVTDHHNVMQHDADGKFTLVASLDGGYVARTNSPRVLVLVDDGDPEVRAEHWLMGVPKVSR